MQLMTMKRNLPNLSPLVSTVLVAGFCGAFLATAADPAPPSQPERVRVERPGPQERRAGAVGIGLDDQQRELYREATQKHRDELRKLDEKLRAAQKELMQSVLAEKYDEKTVREKAEGVAKIQVEIATLRAQALSTVAPTLKPEQREQLVNTRLGPAMLMGGVGGAEPLRERMVQPGRGRPPREGGDQPRGGQPPQ
jgi:Spy/CpxP family protein refolding chaperone